MEDIMKINTYERLFVSKNDIVTDISTNFLEITGYIESELVGKTLLQASKILKIDSQINLQGMKDDTSIFLFSKELIAIEGTLSCKSIDDRVERIFLFKQNLPNLANQKFKYSNQFATIRGEGLAIFSLPSLAIININQNFINFLAPPKNKRSEVIGKSIIEIWPGYLQTQFDSIKEHIINTGEPYHIEELEMYSRNLGEAYWNVTLVPVADQGIFKWIIVNLSNVTERVLNRKKIELKNEELEAIINNMSDEILILDKDCNIIQSNKDIENNIYINKLSGNNFSQAMKYVVAYDKDNNLITYENFPFQRVANGEFISNYLMRIITKVGSIYKEVSGSPIYDKEGNFSGSVMIYRDIEDRMQAEEARLVKTQNELLMKVVESLDLEFIRCTYPELKIVSINGNGFKTLIEKDNGNKSIISPIGQSLFSIYSIDEETKRKELYLNLIEKEYYSYVDYTSHMVNEELRFFKTINQPIFGLNNKIVEIIFITIDITDEVKAKNNIEKTLDQQNQIFANISHELKTPLSVIFSASQLIEFYLKKEVDMIYKENISKSIDTIKQNCFRFTKLINNIVDLSSMESGFYKLHFSNRNIIEIVEDIVDSVRCYVEDKGLNVIFDTDIEEKIMAVDVDKKERIILNLISNAVKFSPKGSIIYVDIQDKGDYIDILIRDSGTGIDRKNLNTIFNKYHKVDNSLNRNTEGSGIGLALVKIMVELVGGKIKVESELNKGTLFTVSLPVIVLDESETISMSNSLNKTMDKINIEFSDIYFN